MSLTSWLPLLALGLVPGLVSAAEPPPRQRFHLYLLLGQSNMAGRAPLAEGAREPFDRVFLLNDRDEWEIAREPLNRYSSVRKWPLDQQLLGPGAAFARRMLDEHPEGAVGLIVNARGGSTLDDWRKGARCYREAVRRARLGATRGILEGVLWNQGESDSKRPQGYLERLARLVADLRADLGAENLPFIAGGVHRVPAINDQLARLPGLVPHTGFAPSSGLAAIDRWHYDAASMETLGRRYADAMVRVRRRLAASR